MVVGLVVLLYVNTFLASTVKEQVARLPALMPPSVVVLNHTNTTQTLQFPNGTIRTFDLRSPYEKALENAHGDMCKIPASMRNDGVLCLPEDKNLTNKFNPYLSPLPIVSWGGKTS